MAGPESHRTSPHPADGQLFPRKGVLMSASRSAKVRWHYLAALLPAGLFALLAASLPATAAHQVLRWEIDWVPALGVDLALRLDGLSMLFGLVITAAGAIISVYSGAYLGPHRYAGRYQLAPGFIVTVTLEGTQLTAQATGQQALPIYPESPTKFFYKVVDAQITFEANDDGKAGKLVLHQHGLNMEAKRK